MFQQRPIDDQLHLVSLTFRDRNNTKIWIRELRRSLPELGLSIFQSVKRIFVKMIKVLTLGYIALKTGKISIFGCLPINVVKPVCVKSLKYHQCRLNIRMNQA